MAETVAEPKHKRTGRPGRPGKPPATTMPLPVTPKKEDTPPKSVSFFQRMSQIQRADWGTRAKVRIYRLEPYNDNLRVSDTKYIKVFNEPVNEELIKRDPACGSGRYRLYLNYKGPSETDKELDSVEIEILDMNFPPRLPRGTWIDDPRNEKWAWAKEFFAKDPPPVQPVAEANNTILHTLEVVDKLRGERGNPIADALGVMDVAEKIAARSVPAPQTENKTLESIVQLMISQMNASEKRSDTLFQLLLSREKNDHQSNGGSSLKEIVSLVKNDVLPLVKELRPGAEEAINNLSRRSKMTGWMEMIQPAIPAALDFFKPIGVAIAQRMMTPAAVNGASGMSGATAVPGALPQAAAANPPQPSAGSFPPILNMIAVPMLGYMRMDHHPQELGEDFASWVHDGYGNDVRFTQAWALARAAGVNSVLVAFKGSPWWLDKGAQHDLPSLAEMEDKFSLFVDAFLRWQPAETAEDDEDVIDISSSGGL